MSYDPTGYWTDQSVKNATCPKCGAKPGSACDVKPDDRVEWNTHVERIGAEREEFRRPRREMTPERARALRIGTTRGPWDDIRVGSDGDGTPRSAEVQICAGDEPNAPAVFLIQGDGSDEWRANVLLAAAAPELIDAYLEEHAARIAVDRPRTYVLVYVNFDGEKCRVGVRAFSAEHATARWKLWEMRGESNGVLFDIEPYDPERDDHIVEIR